MLRIAVITVSFIIIIYGITKLIEMFSNNSKKKSQAAKSLADLEKKAKKVSADKETILGELSKNNETIENINKTLNQ